MERKFEQELTENGEPVGLPEDLFTDPGKYDEQIPLWRRTVGFVKQYETARPKGRIVLLDQMAGMVVKDPPTLTHLANNFELLNQLNLNLSNKTLFEAIVSQGEAVLRKEGTLGWNVGRIEQLIQLGLDTRGYPQLMHAYERLQRALFITPYSVHEAVDLQYNACWAMVTTENEDVRREILSLLCYEREALQATDFSALLFFCGKYFGDDVHIERWFAVIDAINQVAKLMDKPYRADKSLSDKLRIRFDEDQNADQFLSADERARQLKFVQDQVRKNPVRARNLRDASMYEDKIDFLFDQQDPGSLVWCFDGDYQQLLDGRLKRNERLEHLPWPHNLVHNFNEPLRVYITKYYSPKVHKAVWEDQLYAHQRQGFIRLTEQLIQLAEDLDLDVAAKGYETLEQKQAVVREIYRALTGGKIDSPNKDILAKLAGAMEFARAFDGLNCLHLRNMNVIFSISHRVNDEEKGRFASIIQYHRPVISLDQVGAISDQLTDLRREIRARFTASVGKRGFDVVVADPILLRFGYEQLSFKRNSPDDNIQVVINLSGQNYLCEVNSDYRLVLGGDIKKFANIQDQMWLELLLLAHLKKVMCVEEESMEYELVGGKAQLEGYKRQTLNRREYLRKQNPGKRYSTTAFEKCLQSSLDVRDLHLINRLRAGINWGGTLETGLWTYVSPVEKVDVSEAKPVRMSFAKASEDIRKVIPLGQVSAEELARVEQEILRALGSES